MKSLDAYDDNSSIPFATVALTNYTLKAQVESTHINSLILKGILTPETHIFF